MSKFRRCLPNSNLAMLEILEKGRLVMTFELAIVVITCIATITDTVITAVSQGLNRDSLKLLRHSQFSGFQPSLPISFLQKKDKE